MSDQRRLRVVHLPFSVGGNPQGLSRQLRLLGLDSQVWALSDNPFGYRADRVLWADGDGLLRREWKRLSAIWTVARKFDIIHFNFGTTLATPTPFGRDTDVGLAQKAKTLIGAAYRQLLFWFEIWLYRLYRRPMFVHYQGDDARQGDVSLSKFEYSIAQRVGRGYYCSHSDAFKRRMIGIMARLCSRIYALNPDLLYVLPPQTCFMPYSHIQLEEWIPRYIDPSSTSPLRIGHAPSHRGAKGTDLILSVLDRLQSSGYAFELDMIEGVSQQEVRKRLEMVDVVIDQLYVGWYGGVAVEAMALGKPVLVYIREDDLRFVPSQMRSELPFVNVTPDTIEDGLRRVLEMPRTELLSLAHRSRAFVERWHDPAAIAARILGDYLEAMRTCPNQASNGEHA